MQAHQYVTGVDAQGPRSSQEKPEIAAAKSALPYQVAKLNAQGFIENSNDRKVSYCAHVLYNHSSSLQ